MALKAPFQDYPTGPNAISLRRARIAALEKELAETTDPDRKQALQLEIQQDMEQLQELERLSNELASAEHQPGGVR